MQALLQHASFSTATKAATASASRAGSTAEFRPAAQKAQPFAPKPGLSHNARVFTAAAVAEAPPAAVVAAAPSL